MCVCVLCQREILTGPPFSPAGPGGPWGPLRPVRPIGPPGPAAPRSPGEPCQPATNTHQSLLRADFIRQPAGKVTFTQKTYGRAENNRVLFRLKERIRTF